MDDKRIIALLFTRDEEGLRLAKENYAALYTEILRQALSNQGDIDECASDVLNALWNSIPPNQPSHLPSYIVRIARRIGINRFKHNARQKRNIECSLLLSELEGCIPSRESLESRLEARQLQRVLNAFLRDLDPQTRVLFIRRYYYLESVKRLATRFEVSQN